jgi:cobalt-zinc-cadmium efflux system outer membrane protein
MKPSLYWTAVLVLATGVSAFAQEMNGTPTPLAPLIAEAEANNTQISAADHSWKAATHVAQQVTALPDPQFTVQSFNVGSPKPFAGFSNSDFAYIGFGASQELPYPGKLRLKGEVADRNADTQHAEADVLRVSVAEQVKLVYLRLSYFEATLSVLHQNNAVLQPLIQSELSRYSVGQRSQADVLKAQLEHTKILREVAMHHQEMGQLQADLKQLLHRSQDSADIVPEQLTATHLNYTSEQLQKLVQGYNPAVHVDANAVQKQNAQLKSAERNGKPDFNVGYMFQQTGGGYRDYYMLALSMRLPRHKRVEGEIAEATELLNRSKQELDSQTQQQLAEVQKQYVAVTSTSELLKEYQEGLIPQAEAAFHSEEAAYQSNKQQFAPVLSSLLDVLSFENDYQQALLDHETALARLEAMTGATLR